MNASRFLSGALAALLAAAVAAPPAPAQTLPALDATLRAIASRTPPFAFAVVVVRGDSALHVAAYGPRDGRHPVTAHTPFYIGSSTKSFTALTAALLARRGVVDLDAPLARAAPEFALPASLDASRVTLRRLLSHRGGFDSAALTFRTAFSGTLGADSLFAVLARTAAPVDTGFEYTNTQYIIAARVLERATGTPWQELVAREVLRPLGMRDATAHAAEAARRAAVTGWAAGPGDWRPVAPKTDATLHAAGGMYLSAADAARWLRAQLDDGRISGRAALPAGVVASTHVRVAHQDERFMNIHRFGYGLGWQLGVLDGDTLVHHFGNYPGAFAHISLMPAHRVGVAVFTNSELPEVARAAQRIAELAYDVALGRHARDAEAAALPDSVAARIERMRRVFVADAARRAARPHAPPRGWSACAGRYAAPDWGALDIATRGDSAAELRWGTIRTPIEVFSGDTLRFVSVPGRSGQRAPLRFGADGRAESITIDDVTFRRVAR